MVGDPATGDKLGVANGDSDWGEGDAKRGETGDAVSGESDVDAVTAGP